LLTVTDGQASFTALTLAPVGTGHVTGSIQLPAGGRVVQKKIAYRLPIVGATIALPSTSLGNAFDDVVADLGALHGELCVGAVANPGSFQTQRCGVTFDDAAMSLTLQPPPAFISPTDAATLGPDAAFAWTSFAQGVYVFRLEPTPATADGPRVDLYTSDRGTTVADLAMAGIPVAHATAYRCTIGAMGPYETIDRALGPEGVAAPFPAEIRQSFSAPIEVTTEP
jgi:hypothetical protein